MSKDLINRLFAAADQPPANPPDSPFIEAPDFVFTTAPRLDDNSETRDIVLIAMPRDKEKTNER